MDGEHKQFSFKKIKCPLCHGKVKQFPGKQDIFKKRRIFCSDICLNKYYKQYGFKKTISAIWIGNINYGWGTHIS